MFIMDVIEKLALICVIIFDDLPVIKLVKLQDIVLLFVFHFWICTTHSHTCSVIHTQERKPYANKNLEESY